MLEAVRVGQLILYMSQTSLEYMLMYRMSNACAMTRTFK